MTARAAPLSTVALDASLWDEPTTGIALYGRELAFALSAEGVTVEKVGARRSGEWPRGGQGRTAYFLAQLPQVLPRVNAPVFHAVNNFNLPLVRIPGKRLVLTVHDLIPDLFPETVSLPFRWQFRTWLARSVQVADQIICVSERTREDLQRRLRVPERKLNVIHHGVDHVDRVSRPDRVSEVFLETLALPPGFVLYAGSLDLRKNVQLVLDACEKLWNRGEPLTLVLLGQAWFGSNDVEKRIARLRSAGRDVRPLGYQPDPIFYELIRRAGVFVFPSFYEGFGLPPLEAMRLSVPSVVSDGGALPEIVGDGALCVSPRDPVALAETLSRLLASETERRALGERGRRRTEAFRWKATASATLEVYRKALEASA